MTDLTRPIVGIENRTAQEVFDIMVDRFRLQRIPPVDHVAGGEKPFMYGIMEPDGTAYMDEVCVDLSPGPLEELIEESEMTGYTVVPLYLHPATQIEASGDDLRAACKGIADDYMTSENHHPGYVLIPTAKFEAIRAALETSPVQHVRGSEQPATSVEEFYEGDEVAYLRDTLKEVTKERDHFYNQWRACWAPLTPRSEEEKRGFERVLAILKSKLNDGGGIVGSSSVQRAHNDFYRGRRVAFEECATMLHAALKSEGAE